MMDTAAEEAKKAEEAEEVSKLVSELMEAVWMIVLLVKKEMVEIAVAEEDLWVEIIETVWAKNYQK